MRAKTLCPSHLCVTGYCLLLQREPELPVLSRLLLTLDLQRTDTAATLSVHSNAHGNCSFSEAFLHLRDGEGLLLRVLAEADHKEDLRGKQQASSMLLARPADDGHFQGHVQLWST